ncbi:E3 ubiquitin-protein ligase RNF220 [Liparis tanakae]|uniref:E3 ubiquitin-protein ligase RNF220 n=1 Tax=Liparis tanakae TaxID=230148 RepID=A0A4Z2JGS1_9TELE|nr:E3 ubiquitin-protein ligase RNF220 [Liparis tanakae]
MDSSSYLPAPLASPALMVLASTAEAGRDASVPCQASRPFGIPTSVEKELHLPFPSASYTFTSMYQRQGPMSGTFASRDFPASLLHLHPQFTPPNLDCSTLSMLNHSGVGAFRPFSCPQEERESGLYHSAFTPAKRMKSCFPEVEGKEFDFGSPGGSLKAGDDLGRKLFSMSGLLSDGEASSSPEERKEHCKVKGLYDAQAPCHCGAAQPPHKGAEVSDTLASYQARRRFSHIAPSNIRGCSLRPIPARIGKLKRRKQEGGQSLNPLSGRENVSSGAALVSTTSKECRDSDADLDVDGDDTLEYGRAQYTETDIIPCSGEGSKETTVNSSDSRVNLEFSKWSNDGSPSTSSGEKVDGSIAGLPKTCKNSVIETLSEDSTLTTLDALKARIRDLEKQLSKGDRFKCLICMDTYTTPLTSIQCWHVHCEECWLRTLGAKKLCPQCNTITSPGDLRRVYL